MIILFDLDGTIAESGKKMKDTMYKYLLQLKECTNIKFAIIGGGTYQKIIDQIDKALDIFDYIFSECGSVNYKKINNVFIEVSKKNISNYLGTNRISILSNLYVTELNNNDFIKSLNENQYDHYSPGKYVDVRNGLIYFSPVGLYSDDYHRNQFMTYDNETKWRQYMIDKFYDLDNNGINDLEFTFGGSIGIACYPKEWNKIQILPYVESEGYTKIYFFGDRTEKNGNDYHLYNSEKTIGYSVKNPDDTLLILKTIFINSN